MKPKAVSLKKKKKTTKWTNQFPDWYEKKVKRFENTQIINIENERGTNPSDTERTAREYMNFIPIDKTLDKMDKFFVSTNYKSSLKKMNL